MNKYVNEEKYKKRIKYIFGVKIFIDINSLIFYSNINIYEHQMVKIVASGQAF